MFEKLEIRNTWSTKKLILWQVADCNVGLLGYVSRCAIHTIIAYIYVITKYNFKIK